MTTLKSAIACGVVALLVAGNGPALAAKPTPPPPPPDPCTSPSVVTETTFPSFIFSREITVKRGPYTIGAFLADATGKCEKKISEAWPGSQEVNLRFDPDTQRVLIVGDGLRAAMTRVSFSPSSGPSVAPLSASTILLTDEQIETPADLIAAGWSRYGTTYDPRISPDGTQILFHVAYLDSRWSPSWSLNTFWTCDLTYDGNSIIELIDPSSCLEVHRSPVNNDNNYGSHASWGTRPGTIYVLDPWSSDRSQFSLLRRTLPPAVSAGLVEVFRHGTVFDIVRTIATTDPAVESGELVALFELHGPPDWCSNVVVIDAYDCSGVESCEILNNQGQGNGLRSLSWLRDGRLAGSGQSPPNRQNRCVATGTVDAYPGIDPNGTPATVLNTGSYAEGAEGGW